MRKLFRDILTVHLAIVTAGVLLDEAGRGSFGSGLQTLAKKVTRGFGV